VSLRQTGIIMGGPATAGTIVGVSRSWTARTGRNERRKLKIWQTSPGEFQTREYPVPHETICYRRQLRSGKKGAIKGGSGGGGTRAGRPARPNVSTTSRIKAYPAVFARSV